MNDEQPHCSSSAVALGSILAHRRYDDSVMDRQSIEFQGREKGAGRLRIPVGPRRGVLDRGEVGHLPLVTTNANSQDRFILAIDNLLQVLEG